MPGIYKILLSLFLVLTSSMAMANQCLLAKFTGRWSVHMNGNGPNGITLSQNQICSILLNRNGKINTKSDRSFCIVDGERLDLIAGNIEIVAKDTCFVSVSFSYDYLSVTNSNRISGYMDRAKNFMAGTGLSPLFSGSAIMYHY